MAEQRCPLCGKSNQEAQETCQFCGARLKPLVAAAFPAQEEMSPRPPQEKPANGPDADNSIPDWLQALRDGGSAASLGSEEIEKPKFSSDPGILSREKTEPVNKPGISDEIPDWLAGLRNMAAPVSNAASGQEVESSPEEPVLPDEPGSLPVEKNLPEEADASPDWLSRLEVEPRAEPLQETIPAGVVPDWIQALRPVEPPSDEPAGEEAENLPEWLSQMPSIEVVEPVNRLEDESQEKNGSRVDQPTTEQEFIDWFAQLPASLQTSQAGEQKNEETRQAEASAQAPGPQAAIPPVESRDGIEVQSGTTVSGSGPVIPDWLSSLSSDQKSDELEGEQATPGNLGAAELPSWIKALRPVESILSGTVFKKDEVSAKVETMGPLAGLAGVLPMSISESSKRKPPVSPSRLQINSNQQKYASALEKMVQEEGQTRVGKPHGLNPSRLLRILLSVILLAAVLLPLLTRMTIMPELSLFPSEWEKTNRVIQGIPADSPVLVVFEYDPALAGELEAAAAPVINHLLTRGAHLVFVSTSPIGSALGEKFIALLQSVPAQNVAAYTNLGYLAGGPAGIQLFSADPAQALPLSADGKPAWDKPGPAGLQHLSDFGAMLILTDNADTGRLWIEQTKSYIGNVPLLMVTSAQAEPMLRPYFDSGQVQGLVTGLMGGKTYEQTYATPGLARQYWDAFGFGMLTAVILIAAGSLWSGLTTWSTRKKVD